MIKKLLLAYASIFTQKLNVLYTVLIAFFMPIKPLILIVGLMIVCDTIIGIWRAKKMKVPISSKSLSAIVSKMVLYQSAVILLFILEKYLLGELGYTGMFGIDLFATKIAAVVLCGMELMSINESYKIVAGFSLWEKAKLVLRRAKSYKEEINELVEDMKK